MQGKKSESATWIKDYLKSQGVDISDWEEYGPLYNRYRARVKKYHPENYQQFLNLCTFTKQRKKRCGPEDLGDWSRELGGWKKKVGPKEPKEPKPPKVLTFHPTFNEERWWRDQRKEWEEYKLRMKRFREDKMSRETDPQKDLPPYMFKFAIRCLAGVYPLECYPSELEEYREELMKLISTNY